MPKDQRETDEALNIIGEIALIRASSEAERNKKSSLDKPFDPAFVMKHQESILQIRFINSQFIIQAGMAENFV